MLQDFQNYRPFHSHWSMEITVGTPVQARALDESIPGDEEGEAVLLKTFSFDTYTKGEILDYIGKLFNTKHLLHDIDQHHADQLLRSFWFCGYNYAS